MSEEVPVFNRNTTELRDICISIINHYPQQVCTTMYDILMIDSAAWIIAHLVM